MSASSTTIGARLFSSAASHVPCCGAAASMAAFGIKLNIPIAAEMGIVAVSAILAHEGVHALQRRFKKAACCEREDDSLSKQIFYRAVVPASLGLAVWGAAYYAGWHNHPGHEYESAHHIVRELSNAVPA